MFVPLGAAASPKPPQFQPAPVSDLPYNTPEATAAQLPVRSPGLEVTQHLWPGEQLFPLQTKREHTQTQIDSQF